MAPTRRTRQHDAAIIFNADQAARRLLARTSAETSAVMGMSRDELSALAQQFIAVASIAERFHLERASAGSLSFDAHPGPVE